jgi:VCBS repeat-containing protein
MKPAPKILTCAAIVAALASLTAIPADASETLTFNTDSLVTTAPGTQPNAKDKNINDVNPAYGSTTGVTVSYVNALLYNGPTVGGGDKYLTEGNRCLSLSIGNGSITLTPATGYKIVLNSFMVGHYNKTGTSSSTFTVSDGVQTNWSQLVSVTDQGALATVTKTPNFVGTANTPVVLGWTGATGGDAALDLVDFSVVASDTPPVWTSGWPQVDTIATDGFTVRASTNENGNAYYVVVADGAAAPTSAQVKAGGNYGAVTVLASGSIAFTANSEATRTVTGLNAGTAYDVHVVAEDAAANLQASPQLLNVTTSSLSPYASWIAGYPGVGSSTGKTDDPDADGQVNLLEHALGSNPSDPSDRSHVTLGTSGNQLTLTFTPQRVAGLTYVVQASSGMVTWSDTTLTGLTVGTPYTHTDSVSLTGGAKRFLRLKVTSP